MLDNLGSWGMMLDLIGFILIFLFGDLKGVYPRVTRDVDELILNKKKEISALERQLENYPFLINLRKMKMLRPAKRKDFYNNESDAYMEERYSELCSLKIEPKNYLESNLVREINGFEVCKGNIKLLRSEIPLLEMKRKNWKIEFFATSFKNDTASLLGFVLIVSGLTLQFIHQLHPNS